MSGPKPVKARLTIMVEFTDMPSTSRDYHCYLEELERIVQDVKCMSHVTKAILNIDHPHEIDLNQ